MNPLHLTRGMRSLNRLRQIATVLTQHGFGHVVAKIDLGQYLPVWMMHRKAGASPPPVESIGKRLTMVCNELGPTFVKLGQMLGSRPDLLPADIRKDIRVLQDEVEPFASEEARRIIEHELGQSIDDCFDTFDDKPLASGSIGQVHRATLPDGTRVVVKVRRPGIGDLVSLDMQLLRWLANSLEDLTPELAMFRPVVIVQEFERIIERELDYIQEAAATTRIGEMFADNAHVRIPEVHWQLCSPSVMTMSEMVGQNVDHVPAPGEGESAVDRKLLARRLMNCYLNQIFNHGLFHADPHPGNILVEAPASFALVDYGQVGQISDEMMTQLIIGSYAAINNEVDIVIDCMADVGALGPKTVRRDLQRSMRGLLMKYHGLPLRHMKVTTMLHEITDVLRQHDALIPREIIVLIKTLGQVSGVATRLDPDLDVFSLLAPRVKKALRRRTSPKRLARSAAVTGWHMLSILRSAPSTLREGLRRLAAGTWQLNVKHENIDRLARELDRSSNRLSFSVVIAAIIVGSSVVISADSELRLFDIDIQYLGMIGYLVAGMLGLALSWAIFRSGRLH